MKKYELVGPVVLTHGVWARQIRALRDVRPGVPAGALGGYLTSPTGLSHSGEAWVGEDALVAESGRVEGDALVYGHARVQGRAVVRGRAKVWETAVVGDVATVTGEAWVYGRAIVSGASVVRGRAHVRDGALVADPVPANSGRGPRSIVEGRATVCGSARVLGERVSGRETRT